MRALRFRTNGVTITECWLFDHSQHLVAKHGTTATRSTMKSAVFLPGKHSITTLQMSASDSNRPLHCGIHAGDVVRGFRRTQYDTEAKSAAKDYRMPPIRSGMRTATANTALATNLACLLLSSPSELARRVERVAKTIET